MPGAPRIVYNPFFTTTLNNEKTFQVSPLANAVKVIKLSFCEEAAAKSFGLLLLCHKEDISCMLRRACLQKLLHRLNSRATNPCLDGRLVVLGYWSKNSRRLHIPDNGIYTPTTGVYLAGYQANVAEM